TPNVTGRELGAYGAGRGYLARLRHRLNHRNSKPVLQSGGPHQLRVAAAALAEEEVVADHHVSDVQGANQHLLDEPRGRKAGQLGIEREHDGEIEPEALDEPQLL